MIHVECVNGNFTAHTDAHSGPKSLKADVPKGAFRGRKRTTVANAREAAGDMAAFLATVKPNTLFWHLVTAFSLPEK